jgi:hypothetical protein
MTDTDMQEAEATVEMRYAEIAPLPARATRILCRVLRHPQAGTTAYRVQVNSCAVEIAWCDRCGARVPA